MSDKLLARLRLSLEGMYFSLLSHQDNLTYREACKESTERVEEMLGFLKKADLPTNEYKKINTEEKINAQQIQQILASEDLPWEKRVIQFVGDPRIYSDLTILRKYLHPLVFEDLMRMSLQKRVQCVDQLQKQLQALLRCDTVWKPSPGAISLLREMLSEVLIKE